MLSTKLLLKTEKRAFWQKVMEGSSCSVALTSLLTSRFQLQTLYKYIEQKGNLQDLVPLLSSLTKQKTAVTQLAKQGLKDLEELTVLLPKLGVKLMVIQILEDKETPAVSALLCLAFFFFNKAVSPL